MARPRRPPLLVALLLVSVLSARSTALECAGGSGSSGRELVCYTKSLDAEQLAKAVCRCSILVHQGHDLKALDTSELKSLRATAKEANPNLKVVLSINDEHELLKSSATTRQEAAGYLTEIFDEVDGVELNVTTGSKDRLVSFVKGLKDEMVNKSLEKMILLALPTKPEDLAKQFELKELSKYVDLFTVATHYLRDNEEAYRTFHPSRLMGLFDMLNADSLVDLIHGLGAPKHKILFSVPTSAYRFTLKKAEDNTPRSATLEEQPVSIDRKKLCEAIHDGEWTVERDEDLTAPYAFKNTTWIAFEDDTSLKIKGKYVILRELAGLALQDVENDLKNDCGISVTESIYRAFTEMKRKTRDVVLSSLEKDLKGTEIAYPRHVRSSEFRIVRIVDTEGKIQAVRENTQTAFSCTRQGYFTHPRSCNRFYRCVKFNQEIDDYSVFEFDCPAGLTFDEKTEICTWPGSLSKGSACPGSSEIEPVPRARFRCPSRAGFYADPQNCRWFFACYDLGGPEMVPYEFRCPFGLVFDQAKLVCEWPWKVPSCASYGDGHSVYHFGGDTKGQDGFISESGVFGANGFAGQGAGGAGVFNNQGGSGFGYGGADYDGQSYNTGASGSGIGYDGQTYGTAGSAGAIGGYDEQTYNAAGAGAGVGYNGQTHNNAAADSGCGSQGYNTGGYRGQGYGCQTNNADGAGADYDGQYYNNAGAGYDGQAVNRPEIANANGYDYNSQHFNNNGATVGVDAGRGNFNNNAYDGQDANADKGINTDAADYDDQRGGTANINYNGQANTFSNGARTTQLNAAGSATTIGADTFADNSRNPTGFTAGTSNFGAETGSAIGYAGATGIYPGGVTTQYAADGGNTAGVTTQYAAGSTNGYKGNTATGYNAGTVTANAQNFAGSDNGYTGGITTQYAAGSTNGYKGNTATGYNAGTVTANAQNFAGSDNGFTGGVTTQYAAGSTDGYKGNTATGYNAGTVTSNANNFAGSDNGYTGGITTQYAAGATNGYKGNTATGYNAGTATSNANNFAGFDNGYTGGITTQFAAGATNGYKGNTATGYNAGTVTSNANNFADTTGSTGGATSQANLFTDSRLNTNFGGSTQGFANTDFTKSGPNTQNFNTFGSTAQTGFYDGADNTVTVGQNRQANDGLSTVDYQNSVGAQNTGLYASTQFAGPSVYNSTAYNAAVSPMSTIIPFENKQNNYDGTGYRGTTSVNSKIYRSQVTTGLSSTEYFENEYVNQAGKSFSQEEQAPSAFEYISKLTKYAQNFNAGTNMLDNSNINLAGTADYRGSTIAQQNYAGPADEYENSQVIGSSLANNDITRFRESTESPNSFRFNGQTTAGAGAAGTTSYNNDARTFYNQGLTANANAYTNFAKTNIPTAVTPANNIQNFNNGAPEGIPLDARPAVELDNTGLFGPNFAGSRTTVGVQNAQTTGYQTNEYHDNGGRGTIRYNNGVVTSKGEERDKNDNSRSSYTSIPNSFIINAGNGESARATAQTYDSSTKQQYAEGTFTREGFTKTGPTKTGITTAQVGGSGSYVIGTGAPRERPDPQLIGANAFAGTFQTTGASNLGATTNFGARETATSLGATGIENNFGQRETQTNFGTGSTSNFAGSTGGYTSNEFSNSNSGSKTNAEFEGYSYPKPLIQLEIKGPSTPVPAVPQTNYIDSSTPSSISNSESFDDQNSIAIESARSNEGLSTTVAPIGFTTGPLENFRTTVYQAVRLPQTVSTVQPVIDTGSRTVVSSTPVPAVISTQSYQTDDFTTQQKTFLDVGVSFGQGNDYNYNSQDSSDYSDVTSNFDQGNFGQKIAGQTRITNANYQQTTKNVQTENQNNEQITSTQGNYNVYGLSETGATAQRGFVRNNQVNFRPTVTIPKQVFLPSTTKSPLVGVTFRQPIVAAEFTQQSDRSSASAVSQNTNFASRGTANRVETNQPSRSFVRQRPISLNQQADFNSRGPANSVLENQAFASFSSQGSTNEAFGDRATGSATLRGSSNLKSQNSEIFVSRGSSDASFGRQESMSFNLQGSYNGAFNNEASRNSFSGQNQGFSGKTRTLVGSNVVTGGAAFNNQLVRQNIAGQENAHAIQSSTAVPEVTTFSGQYRRVESSGAFDARTQNKKVVVKLSDLHPLILGKLGAECTCKADPFAVFRGPNRQSLPINSQNRGPVDLANYDESEIYVDLDGDKENQAQIDLARNIPSNRLIKTSNAGRNEGNIVVTSRGEPHSLTTARTSSSSYLPPAVPSNAYLPSSTSAPAFTPVVEASLDTRSQPLLIKVEDNNGNGASIARGRSGKTLFRGGSTNELKGQGLERVKQDSLDGGLECARPGLFRHPKFCNKFYACHWDEWKKRFTLHTFNCPVHLAFDSSAGACNFPSKGPACQDNKLLV